MSQKTSMIIIGAKIVWKTWDQRIHAIKIIDCEEKEIISLANEENQLYHKKNCFICKKEFSTDYDVGIYYKATNHCYNTSKYKRAAHKMCNLEHKTLKDTPVVFDNGSKYLYYFIIKELAEEIKIQFILSWVQFF